MADSNLTQLIIQILHLSTKFSQFHCFPLFPLSLFQCYTLTALFPWCAVLLYCLLSLGKYKRGLNSCFQEGGINCGSTFQQSSRTRCLMKSLIQHLVLDNGCWISRNVGRTEINLVTSSSLYFSYAAQKFSKDWVFLERIFLCLDWIRIFTL